MMQFSSHYPLLPQETVPTPNSTELTALGQKNINP